MQHLLHPAGSEASISASTPVRSKATLGRAAAEVPGGFVA